MWTDPIEVGVEPYSPDQLDGAGQKLTGFARPAGVEQLIGEAAGVLPAFSGNMPPEDFRSGAHGQIVLRQDVPASVGVQIAALRGVDANTPRELTTTWTGS